MKSKNIRAVHYKLGPVFYKYIGTFLTQMSFRHNTKN